MKNEINYEQNYFINRIKIVQNIITNNNFDALLLILGSDGLNNKANNILMNYIFEGKFGKQIVNEVYLKEYYEETFIIISNNSFKIFTTNDFYNKFSNFILLLENIYVFVADNNLLANNEAYERTKIKEFYKMTQNFNSYGILFDGEFNKRVIKDIETWPLIQSYSLQVIENTFFSMSKAIINASNIIFAIYKDLEEHYINNILYDYLPNLNNTFNEIIQIIDDTNLKKKDININHNILTSILQQYFELREINFNQKFDSKAFDKPYTYFGIYSYLKILDNNTSIKDTGHIVNENSIHLIIENSDPISGIRVGRTYFLTSNMSKFIQFEEVLNDEGYLSSYNIKTYKDKLFLDEFKITNIYMKCCNIYFKFINNLFKNLTNNSSIDKLKSLILKKISIVNNKLLKREFISCETVQITLKKYDAFANEYDFDYEFIPNKFYILVFKIEIIGLTSIYNEKEKIGNIILCDSILIYNEKFLILTQNIPYFNFFETRNSHTESISNLKDHYTLKIFGERYFLNEKSVEIYIPLKNKSNKLIDFPVINCSISLYEKCIKFITTKIGDFILFFNEIEKCFIYRVKDNFCMSLLLKENKFFSKISEKYFLIEFNNEAKNIIFYKIISLFEHSLNIQIEHIYSLPNIYLNCKYLNDRMYNFKDGIENNNSYIDIDEMSDFINVNNFLNILDIKEKYNYENISDILFNSSVIKRDPYISKNNDACSLYLITGNLFSGKRKLLENIKNNIKKLPINNDIKIHFLSYNNKIVSKINNNNYYEYLEHCFTKENINTGDIAFIVVPHIVDHIQLITKLLAVNKIGNIPIKINSVCSKIKLNSIFDNNKNLMENIKTYFQLGFIHFIIIDSNGIDINKSNNLYYLLEQSFFEVKFIKIDKIENIIYSKLNDYILYNQYYDEKNNILRDISVNKYNFSTNNNVLYIPYRQLYNKQKFIDYFKTELFYNCEGVIFYKKKKIDIGTYNDILYKKNLRKKVEDKLANEIEALKAAVDPLKKIKTNKYPIIKGIQGVIRFENELENLYYFKASKYNFELELMHKNLSISSMEYEGNYLKKPDYSSINLNIKDIGVLLYGDNLDTDIITKLFNNILLTNIELDNMIAFKDISEDKIKELEIAYQDFSNDGSFNYDGFIFRDDYGKPLEGHPFKQKIIEKYITETNLTIETQNKNKKLIEKNKRKFYQNN